jgi:hypothetical protein
VPAVDLPRQVLELGVTGRVGERSKRVVLEAPREREPREDLGLHLALDRSVDHLRLLRGQRARPVRQEVHAGLAQPELTERPGQELPLLPSGELDRVVVHATSLLQVLGRVETRSDQIGERSEPRRSEPTEGDVGVPIVLS